VAIALALAVVSPARTAAQIKSNFASSVTSESMAAVWVARDRGLFKKYGLTRNSFSCREIRSR